MIIVGGDFMSQNKIQLADYVDPYIGSIGHLLKATRPVVLLPHSMAQVQPITDPEVNDLYLTDHIYGFQINGAAVMAGVGDVPNFISKYDHDFEFIKCYRGWVLLEDSGIEVSYTVSAQAIRYRFAFPQGKKAWIRFSSFKRGSLSLKGADSVNGWQDIGDARGYFSALVSVSANTIINTPEEIVLGFDGGQTIELDVGVSYIDENQARRNREREITGKTFDEIADAAREAWNKALGFIEVEGGTEAQKRTFYTALYRVFSRMTNITEDGRYYSGYDRQVHEDNEHDFYVNDGLWDTYRCAHPLQLMLEPDRQMDIINSYLRQYQQSGWLPSFPHVQGGLPVMLGKHATAMIADTWMKGYHGFDINLAYEAMLKNADEATKLPWSEGRVNAYDFCYFEKGFFPALPDGEKETLDQAHPFERRQCVSVTLETAYDDWCLSRIARALGKSEDAERFEKRGQNYRNCYNPESGFMSPRTADGRWVEDYDPKLSGGQGGRAYFAECNGWTYSLHVQQDVEGLVQLMGGKESFIKYLDRMFIEQPGVDKFYFLGQFPDSTGLMGQFYMGNEPSFHIPYLYNYVGQPWKTQRRLREIMRLWFNDSPFGICGDEDGGAMSAWFVYSAMGFYPVCPGKPEYEIGSPIFDKVHIHLPNGKTFSIVAQGQTERTKYIKAADLNGSPYNTTILTHLDIIDGGELVLQMSETPNKQWGIGR